MRALLVSPMTGLKGGSCWAFWLRVSSGPKPEAPDAPPRSDGGRKFQYRGLFDLYMDLLVPTMKSLSSIPRGMCRPMTRGVVLGILA